MDDLSVDQGVVRPGSGANVDSAVPGVAAMLGSRDRGPHLHGRGLLFGVDRLPVLAGLFRRERLRRAGHRRVGGGGWIQAVNGVALSSTLAGIDLAAARNPARAGS